MAEEQKADRFTLPKLPWAKDALKGKGISQETIEYHYGKHHAGYVRKLNAQDKDGNVPKGSLEDLIKTSEGKIFNLAAQIYNHTFYWNSMAADGGKCDDKLNVAKQLTTDFGSVDKFIAEFKARAGGHFGSGWVWLSLDDKKKLVITDGHDAFCPLKDGLSPVLTIDGMRTYMFAIHHKDGLPNIVWEHAYYVDQRNNRGEYIKNFVSLINWAKVEERFNAASK